MTRSRKIAITGGSGSGKSEVCKIIEAEGYPVFSCDKIYSELLADKNFLENLSEVFGDILNYDGTLDRIKLSRIVYSDGDKLKQLNQLTHPEIMKEAIKRMNNFSLSFCEVPLLFEGGFEKLFDRVMVVLRGREDRINSLTVRDKKNSDEIKRRLNCQIDYDKYDFTEYNVIHNTGNFDDLINNTLKYIELIKEEFNEEQN